MATVIELPTMQTAIMQSDGGQVKIQHEVSLPEIQPHQMLVKTAAVAINPCDFKMAARFPTPGLWDGCDFAGTVVKLGAEVEAQGRFRIGDRVFGAVQGSNMADPEQGAFCEFLKAEGTYTFKMIDDMSFKTAAAMCGTGIATIGMALFRSLKLPGTLEKPAAKPRDVLVYGGSSTIGLIAIQMVKLWGHRVISTCSAHNFDLVTSYGADAVFDYRSPTCASDIKAYTKNSLAYIIDPFAEAKTISLCYAAMGRAGGRYCALEAYQDMYITRKTTIKAEMIMGSAITGRGVVLPDPYGVEPDEELRAWSPGWYQSVQKLVDEGKLKPCPIQLIPGRFEGILQGLEMLKKKQVSGKKLIVQL